MASSFSLCVQLLVVFQTSQDIHGDSGIFEIQVAERFAVFMDGFRNVSGNVATQTYASVIDSSTRLVAVIAGGGGSGNFIKISSRYIDSQDVSRWKCVQTQSDDPAWVESVNGWNRVNFDDSSWSTPTSTGTVDSISTFWLAGLGSGPTSIYCRGKTACATAVCDGKTTCSNLDLTTYKCVCSAGFAGADCNINIDECASSPCVQLCNDTINGYTCHCRPGYLEPNCKQDTRACASSPCLHNGFCSQSADTYTCQCVLGYTGMNCEIPPSDSGPLMLLAANQTPALVAASTQTSKSGSGKRTTTDLVLILSSIAATCVVLGAVTVAGRMRILRLRAPLNRHALHNQPNEDDDPSRFPSELNAANILPSAEQILQSTNAIVPVDDQTVPAAEDPAVPPTDQTVSTEEPVIALQEGPTLASKEATA